MAAPPSRLADIPAYNVARTLIGRYGRRLDDNPNDEKAKKSVIKWEARMEELKRIFRPYKMKEIGVQTDPHPEFSGRILFCNTQSQGDVKEEWRPSPLRWD